MIRQNTCPELLTFDQVVAPNAIYGMDRWSAESLWIWRGGGLPQAARRRAELASLQSSCARLP